MHQVYDSASEQTKAGSQGTRHGLGEVRRTGQHSFLLEVMPSSPSTVHPGGVPIPNGLEVESPIPTVEIFLS